MAACSLATSSQAYHQPDEIYLIDLNGLCFFCLMNEVDFSLSDDDDDDKLRRFQQSWAYIKPRGWNAPNAVFVVRGEENIDGEDTTTEICSKIPPMCIACSFDLDHILQCHEEILELQRRQEAVKSKLSSTLKSVQGRMSSSATDLSKKANSHGLQKDTVNYIRILRNYLPNVCREPSSSQDKCKRVKSKLKCKTEQKSYFSSTAATVDEEDDQVNSNVEVKIEAEDEESNSSTTSPGEEDLGTRSKVDVKSELAQLAEESNSTSIPILSEDPSFCVDVGSPEHGSKSKKPESECEIVGEMHSMKSACGRYLIKSENRLFQMQTMQSQEVSNARGEREFNERKRRQLSTGAIKEPPRKQAKPFTENKCEICAEIVPRLSMYDHMYSHVGSLAYRCPVTKCGQAFASRYSVCCTSPKLHRLRCPVEKRCETCGEDFIKLKQLAPHLKRHETFRKIFNCPIIGCGNSFTVKQSLEHHMRSHFHKFEKMKRLQTCSLCMEDNGKVQNFTPEKFEVHLKKLHGLKEVVKCNRCPFVFPNKEDFVDHVVKHIKDGGVRCDMCSLEDFFATGHSLRSHYFNEHQIGRQFPCELCGKNLFSLGSLKEHMAIRHEGKPKRAGGSQFTCEVCGPEVVFKQPSSLETHNIKVHGAEELKCRFCEKTFGSRNGLVEHERYDHLGVKRPTYTCTVCKSVFDSRRHLKAHMENVHSLGRSRVSCSECEKTFKSDAGLKHHVNVEHKGMRHICEICGKGFRSPQILDEHKLIHTGERPYSCDLCGHRFRQSSALYNHMKGHRRKGHQFAPKKTFDRTPKVD